MKCSNQNKQAYGWIMEWISGNRTNEWDVENNKGMVRKENTFFSKKKKIKDNKKCQGK